MNIFQTDGYAPKDIGELIKDVTKELHVADFDSTATAIPTGLATQIEGIQSVMSAYVHDTPVLASMTLDHGEARRAVGKQDQLGD